MSKNSQTAPSVELERKFGFRETREDREKRLKEEKVQKWQQKLDKEDLGKLQKELDSLKRAEFLSPPQRERKRYVEKVVTDLLRQKAKEQGQDADCNDGHVAENCADSDRNRGAASDSDDEGEIFGVKIADAFAGTTDVEAFVPRSVKARRVEKQPKKTEEIVDDVKLAEKEILSAFVGPNDDDLDDFLDSL